MRFRRVYWVTEQIETGGKSRVTGVYTSMPDLIDVGLLGGSDNVRLSLCELDSAGAPLLCCDSADFENMAAHLRPFVESGEFSSEDVLRLQQALKNNSAVK